MKGTKKTKLKKDIYALHFDGKRIKNREYQVVILKSETKEIKLDILCLNDGKSETISQALEEVISEYDLWNCIKMIICDTTNVNTGRTNGVVVRLQRLFEGKGLEKPQFIGCQQHILDRILRLVMDVEVGEITDSPNISYEFVPEIVNHYDQLRAEFNNGEDEMEVEFENISHDDMKFLYHLIESFKFYKENKKFPMIKFQTIPNISNARWNSRAILVLLAYTLIPEKRNALFTHCKPL